MTSALVIGGGSGIGAALVDLYRARDVPVVVWDVAGERDVTCDITDPDAIDDAVSHLGDAIPSWVTVTAGRSHAGLLLDAKPDEWNTVVDLNAKGAWLAMRAMARMLRDAGRSGSIVATTSVSAHIPDRGMGLYGASKAALSAIVRVAAVEWAEFGIRVNGIGTGVTQTPMLGRAPADRGWLAEVQRRTPLGRLGEAADIAPAIHALHQLEWVTGQVLDCDGGLSLHSPIEPFGPRR